MIFKVYLDNPESRQTLVADGQQHRKDRVRHVRCKIVVIRFKLKDF